MGLKLKLTTWPLPTGISKNCGPADQVLFSPSLTTHDERRLPSLSPHSITMPLRSSGPSRHVVQYAIRSQRRGVLYRAKILPEDVSVRRIPISDRMIGTIECDSYMCAGRSCAACCEAAEDAPPPLQYCAELRQTIAAQTANQPAFKSQACCRCPRVTIRPPSFDKALNLRQSFVTNAASDVVRFCGQYQNWASAGVFLKGMGDHGFRQPFDLLGQFQIDMAIEQHINARAKIAGADVFIAKIGVGNLALIERVADPSDRVRVCPWNPYANARCFCRWCGTSGMPRQRCVKSSPSSGSGHESHRQSRLSGKNPGTSGKSAPPRVEVALGDLDLEIRKPVAGCEQTIPALCPSADRRCRCP